MFGLAGLPRWPSSEKSFWLSETANILEAGGRPARTSALESINQSDMNITCMFLITKKDFFCVLNRPYGAFYLKYILYETQDFHVSMYVLHPSDADHQLDSKKKSVDF